mgnify:CR=1 FL=1
MVDITTLENTNIIHTRIAQKISAEDYEQMIPIINQMVDKYGSVRWIYELIDEPGIEPEAIWKDAKTSFSNLTNFDKVALIASRDWLKKVTNIGDAITPFDMKYFESHQRQKAIDWIKK